MRLLDDLHQRLDNDEERETLLTALLASFEAGNCAGVLASNCPAVTLYFVFLVR